MKIVVTANTAFNLVNFRSGLIRGLISDGHEVAALAPDDGHAACLAKMGCEIVPLRMNQKGTAVFEELRLLVALWRAFHSLHPDVVLSFTIKNNLYGAVAARALGIPVIPNVTGLGVAFASRNFLNRLVVGLYRRTFPHLPVVFFQNMDDRELFRSLGMVESHQARVLPGSGVDTEAFAAVPLPGDERRVTFLLVSRLLWAKGIGEFVESARAVRRTVPEARFQILGRTEPENRYAIPRDVIDGWVSQGDVEYLGELDDVRPAIAGADCVVLPSYYREGTPRALLEAASMGRPIVTTDMPGCRDVVADGVSGLLCRPRDASDLAEKLRQVAVLGPDDRKRMGDAGRRKVEECFEERLVVDAYRRAFVDLERTPRVRLDRSERDSNVGGVGVRASAWMHEIAIAGRRQLRVMTAAPWGGSGDGALPPGQSRPRSPGEDA